jgi:hypothetical protein
MTSCGRGSSGKGSSGWLSMGGAPRRAKACRAMATGRPSGSTNAGAGQAIGSPCPTFGWRTCPLLSSVLSSLAGTLCTRGSAGRSVGTPREARSDSRGRAELSHLVERRTRFERLQEAVARTHSNDSAEEVMRRQREERVRAVSLGSSRSYGPPGARSAGGSSMEVRRSTRGVSGTPTSPRAGRSRSKVLGESSWQRDPFDFAAPE